MARNSKPDDSESQAVPTTRAGRFGRMAQLAGGIASGMVAEGARQLRSGKRPRAKDMLLTPANARRLSEQLATMRGAAMKVGQMLSMDGGEFLPPELTEILARLRSDAKYMPPEQLQQALVQAYGEDWESLLYGFETQPLAAASIGQVHKAFSPDGREIVLKIQYPGVAQSIDSDVDNIAGLLRLTGLLPDNFDIQPLLEDAKTQLQAETDYEQEAKHLQAFAKHLRDDERFLLPEVIPALLRPTVLPMTYISGVPIETLAEKPQQERNRVMSALFELFFRELLQLKLVQTDPNFANYRYRPSSGQIILLDFGATRRFKAAFVKTYKGLAAVAVELDVDGIIAAAERLGYVMGAEGTEYRAMMEEGLVLALEPLGHDKPFDFAGSDLSQRLAELGEGITRYREFWHAPPMDVMYVQRKLGGLFLLATRVRAKVNVHRLLHAALGNT